MPGRFHTLAGRELPASRRHWIAREGHQIGLSTYQQLCFMLAHKEQLNRGAGKRTHVHTCRPWQVLRHAHVHAAVAERTIEGLLVHGDRMPARSTNRSIDTRAVCAWAL